MKTKAEIRSKHEKIVQKEIKKALAKPYLFAGEVNVLHWLSEKSKIYARFQNGLPSHFDNIKVEYAEPEGGWMDTTFYVNGEKMLVVPLSDIYNPLGEIIKWLEAISVEQSEELSWTLHLDCESGCHTIWCYEQINYLNKEFGLFYAYGSWTEDEALCEKTVSAFCLKSDLIDAIYTPLKKLWEGYVKNKRYKALGEEDYQWDLPFEITESPQQILDIIKSEKIDTYLKNQKRISDYYGFEIEEIDEFRRQLAVCLGIMKDEKGKPYCDAEYIRACTGHSYESLAEVMQYHTPQSWADMITM